MQTELVENCPICKGTNFESTLTCRDHTYSHQSFHIQKCLGCNLLLTNPRPDADSIGHYYKSIQYVSHTGVATNIFDSLYFAARTLTLKWKYKLISRHLHTGTILDYGCGTGEFLSQMSKQNWRVLGVEPSAAAREKANKLIDLQTSLVSEKLAQLGDNKFDVITLWHVLEHVPHPDLLLAKLKSYLKNDGLIIVAVPNYESHDADYYKHNWAGYDLPRHFWHFSQSSLQQLLLNAGFRIKQKVPMKLDAYYVSLLSEKYRSNRTNNLFTPFKAITRGFISNVRAKKSMNYSSLIYIAHHA